MKKVLTYGTFDLFHIGHLRVLERAKELGEYLIVGISTDEFNLSKGKSSFISFEDRSSIVKSLKVVDSIIPETNWDQKIKDIKDNDIDIFVMGDDWRGKFDYLSKYCEVVYLDRTPGVSTTMIKRNLQSENS